MGICTQPWACWKDPHWRVPGGAGEGLVLCQDMLSRSGRPLRKRAGMHGVINVVSEDTTIFSISMENGSEACEGGLTSLESLDNLGSLEPMSATCWMHPPHRNNGAVRMDRWQRPLVCTAGQRSFVYLTDRHESKGQGCSCLGTGPGSIQQTRMIS